MLSYEHPATKTELMDKETLTKLNDARQKKLPVVLISRLSHGEHTLFYGNDKDISSVPSEYQLTATQALQTNRCQIIESDSEKIFFQPFNPPLRMIIVGAVHIAQALVPLAQQCDYQVIIIDPRMAFAATERFPGTQLITDWPDKALEQLALDNRSAVVALTHDPKLDDPALSAGLRSQAFYIGALGSRKTQQARQKRLSANGFTEAEQSRIHGPIGLDIGAQSPAEIAVAIMAQITDVLHKDQ